MHSSDYGSGGSSMNSSTSWGSQELNWNTSHSLPTKAASYANLVSGRCTLDDVMQEFRMNGSDAPYNPDEDAFWTQRSADTCRGPAPLYGRQQSWPAAAAERPAPPAPRPLRPRPLSASYPSALTAATADAMEPTSSAEYLTAEQMRVLGSLPDIAVATLLHELRRRNRPREPEQECRFCKNNNERSSFYRMHTLKDRSGRVSCPVLRAFTCPRCGASGDSAHTLKYCPLSTADERIQSDNMMRTMRMRSKRMASGHRRNFDWQTAAGGPARAAATAHHATHSALQAAPLDLRWIALEKKLMLS